MVVQTAGVVGYWRLGESSGSVACDGAGSSPGAYAGGVSLGLPGAIGGDTDTAAGFDGQQARVSVANTAALRVGDVFSVEAWVRRGLVGTGGNQVVASKQDGSWVLMFSPDDRLVLRRSNRADVVASTVRVTDTAGWHHVAVTKSGGSVHLYVDGADVTGTVSRQTMVDNSLPMGIGQSSDTAYFAGSIDEVALYRTVLTSAQIRAHDDAGTSAAPPAAPTGLTAVAGDQRVSLAWGAGIDSDLSGYRVYRRSADGSWPSTPLVTTTTTTRNFVDSGLPNGQAQTYRVTSVDRAGHESVPSNTATATPAPAGCAPPSGTYASMVVQTAGVVGYWRLGESSGSVACDGVGSAPGAYAGGVALGLPGAIGGDADTAAGFDGQQAQVSVPDTAALRVGDVFTVEAWVRRGLVGTSGNQVVASKQDGSWVLMFSPDDRLVLRRSNRADVVASTTRLTDTSGWHHVAATKDGGSVHLYVDGVDVTGTVDPQTMVANSLPMGIGQSSDTAYFAGSIDEVALYRTALTGDQLRSHRNAGVTPTPSNAPVIAVAGDIACQSNSSSYNAGNGTATQCRQRSVSDLLVGGGLAGVLPLGDNQYEVGSLSEFRTVYDASWGRVKSLTRPVIGNHEYNGTNPSGYFDYFNGTKVKTGVAGTRNNGWYSYNQGAWHVVVLNSNCSLLAGGCGVGSAQEAWLRADLRSSSARCTLAAWHHPRFTSGGEAGGNTLEMQPIWQDLQDAGADLVITGHDHDYERFAPQDADGRLDEARGLREFVVGTGGRSHHAWGTVQPNSEVRDNATFGVLKLSLRSTGYDWQFVPEAGRTFTDAGSAACH